MAGPDRQGQTIPDNESTRTLDVRVLFLVVWLG